MGFKRRCKQSEYFTWWGVPNVNIKHMPLSILYCGTVMEALHNAEFNCCSAYIYQWPSPYSMQCLINRCFTQFFWGEIQCSTVPWLCWWYTALLYYCKWFFSDAMVVQYLTGNCFGMQHINLYDTSVKC